MGGFLFGIQGMFQSVWLKGAGGLRGRRRVNSIYRRGATITRGCVQSPPPKLGKRRGGWGVGLDVQSDSVFSYRYPDCRRAAAVCVHIYISTPPPPFWPNTKFQQIGRWVHFVESTWLEGGDANEAPQDTSCVIIDVLNLKASRPKINFLFLVRYRDVSFSSPIRYPPPLIALSANKELDYGLMRLKAFLNSLSLASLSTEPRQLIDSRFYVYFSYEHVFFFFFPHGRRTSMNFNPSLEAKKVQYFSTRRKQTLSPRNNVILARLIIFEKDSRAIGKIFTSLSLDIQTIRAC